MVCCGTQFIAWFALFLNIGRHIRIVDVFQEGDKLVVTTLQPHGIKVHGLRSTVVRLAGTGHPRLDEPPSAQFRACVLDPERFELCNMNGTSILERIDASMGTVRQCFPRDLLHTGAWVPTAVVSSVLLPAPGLLGFCKFYLQAFEVSAQPRAEMAILTGATAAAALVGIAAAAIARLRYARAKTPIQERRQQLLQRLLQDNPNPPVCPPGPWRAVEMQQLALLLHHFRDFVRDRNTYYVSANITKPLTSACRLSYAELAGPKRLQYFVSHHWGTGFGQLVKALQQHARFATGGAAWPSVAYWVCFLSINQWSLLEDLGTGVEQSSFYQALRSPACLATCLVLDGAALALTRSWCLFEALHTYLAAEGNAHFQGLLFCTEHGVLGAVAGGYDLTVTLGARLVGLSITDAKASCKEDQLLIAQGVEDMGGAGAADELLRERLAAALRAAQGAAAQLQEGGADGTPRSELALDPDTDTLGVGGVLLDCADGERGAGSKKGLPSPSHRRDGVFAQLQRSIFPCWPWWLGAAVPQP